MPRFDPAPRTELLALLVLVVAVAAFAGARATLAHHFVRATFAFLVTLFFLVVLAFNVVAFVRATRHRRSAYRTPSVR